MKILHVITSMATGGAEHLMVDLLPRLRDLGNEVELLLFDGRRTPFRDQLEATGITIHSLGTGGNVYHPRNLWRLTQFLRKHHYDIVHTHNTACQLFAPVARILSGSHCRLFTTEHSANNRRRGKWWLKPIDQWMYARYEAVICISEQPRLNLERHIGKHDNICTILNGVDVQKFWRPIKEMSPPKSPLKRGTSCSGSETELPPLQGGLGGAPGYVITMVASLSAAKDQDTLIRAMALLPDGYRLQLVGDGVRRGALEALVHELGLEERVSLLGVRTDIPELMEGSDVMVLSSHWEGLSLSSIEGMASGRPFVASDVDGLREVVDGYGVMFPEGDATALAEAIEGLCSNPEHYRAVATRCQARAQQFDISVMAINYNKKYTAI